MLRQLQVLTDSERSGHFQTEARHSQSGAATRAISCVNPAWSDTSMAAAIQRADLPINFNMGTLVGSYARVAAMLDEASTIPGVKGIMLTFDDFLAGMDGYGTRIQPLMHCRKHILTSRSGAGIAAEPIAVLS